MHHYYKEEVPAMLSVLALIFAIAALGSAFGVYIKSYDG